MYRNAKQELLKAIENNSVVCAEIYFNNSEKISLSSLESQSKNYWDKFLSSLNKKYDAGWGHQYLYGWVILSDGSWLEREEYDGSEWWEKRIKPLQF